MMRVYSHAHGRLQEYVAKSRGYFRKFGVDWIESPLPKPNELHATIQVSGPSAYADFIKKSARFHLSSTSHWAVARACHEGYGSLWRGGYSLMPAGIYGAPTGELRTAQDLAGVNITVGRHSGAHFAATHALSGLLERSAISFSFIEGPGNRLQHLLSGSTPAACIYGFDSYFLEQIGFKKIIDVSFLVTFMIMEADDAPTGFFEAIARSQRDIDEQGAALRLQYLHHEATWNDHAFDALKSGSGERYVTATYTDDMFDAALKTARDVMENYS